MSNTPRWWPDAEQQIEAIVAQFPADVRAKLTEKFKPHERLRCLNPFLFRMRVTGDGRDLAMRMIDGFLVSSEETMFGNVLESTARAVCSAAYGGHKHAGEVDVEFTDSNGIRVFAEIKSGTNWGNAKQREKMTDVFARIRKQLRTSGTDPQNARFVEGCCYGTSRTTAHDGHDLVVGNDLWFLLSGWDGTAQAIYAIMGQHAGNGLKTVKRNTVDALAQWLQWARITDDNDVIDWNRILELNMMDATQRKTFNRRSGKLWRKLTTAKSQTTLFTTSENLEDG